MEDDNNAAYLRPGSMECPHCRHPLTPAEIKKLWAQLCNSVRWRDRPQPSMGTSMEHKKPIHGGRKRRSMDKKKPSMETPSMEIGSPEFLDLPLSERMRMMREK